MSYVTEPIPKEGIITTTFRPVVPIDCDGSYPRAEFYRSASPVSFVPLMAGTIGATPVPCTTPPSALPPSPPAFLSGPLPRVFVSDHSEAPRPSDPARTEVRDQQATGTECPRPVMSSHSSRAIVNERRSSLPDEVPKRAIHPDEPPKRDHQRVANKSHTTCRPTEESTTSSPPTTNNWLRRIIVLGICALVLGLALKIGVELWRESYGENSA